MASGSAVTITGGTNMTQVVAGTDTIAAADFNNARTNVNTLLSGAADVTTGTFTVANTYGWNQGGAGVSAASAGNTVQDTGAGGFKDLQDDVQAMCAFLGQSVRSGVGSDVSTSDTITAATWNNLMLNVKDCWDNIVKERVTGYDHRKPKKKTKKNKKLTPTSLQKLHDNTKELGLQNNSSIENGTVVIKIRTQSFSEDTSQQPST